MKGRLLRRMGWLVAPLLLQGRAAEAQTNCAGQHTESGVFICYPNPAEDSGDSTVPNIFHLSAQGNPAAGQAITGYRILIDNRVVYENRLLAPIEKLSIEANLKSPFDSGQHLLRLVVQGAGSAEVQGLHFYPSRGVSFCEPFSRTDPRVCNPSTIRSPRGPLQWSLPEGGTGAAAADAFDRYSAYLTLYGQNLKSMEADISDAMAVDAQGNLYVASHAFADVDLRKYAPNGSLIHASLIRSCGDGFLSVAGLAIDNAGRAWIAGNTTACLSTTPNAVPVDAGKGSGPHGFIMLVDTTKPSSAGPVYVTHLSGVEYRIAGIRVDSSGNVFVAGTTGSPEFPHESSLSLAESAAASRGTGFGFVSALNPSGSGLLWSSLVQNVQLTALALDDAGNVYVTGRAGSDVLVAGLSDRGRRFSYVARLGGSADEEGRAISATAQGAWIFVAGATASADFPTTGSAKAPHRDGLQSFAVGLQPCKTGVQFARLLAEADGGGAPGIASAPALDAFTAGFSRKAARDPIKARQKPIASVPIAPACPSAKP